MSNLKSIAMFDVKTFTSKYPKTTTTFACLVALIILTVVLKVFGLDTTLQSFELKTLDWRFQEIQAPEKIDKDIVLIVLDDISKQRAESDPNLSLSNTILPDNTTAKVLRYLNSGKAKYIVFNSKFEGAKLNASTSKNFLKEVKKAGNVFFPVVFSNSNQSLLTELQKNKNEEAIKNPEVNNVILDFWKKNLLNTNSEKLRKELEKFNLDIINEDLFTTFPYRHIISFNTFGPVYYEILQNAFKIGAINVNVSDDGVLRKMTPIYNYNKNFYPGLPLSVAMAVRGEENSQLKFTQDGKLYFGDTLLPLDNNGELFIRWLGTTGAYKHYRISDIISSQINIENNKEPIVNPQEFEGKIVIIGETFAGSNILTTPISRAISGVEIQANSIDNLLNNKVFIQPVHPLFNFLIALVLSILTSIFVMRIKSGFTVAVSLVGIIVIYLIIALKIFSWFSLWIDIVYPLTFITIVFIMTFLVKYTILSKAYEDTFQLAIKDGLTNLYNHKYFQETFQRDIYRARRHKEEISLLLVDIDHFKKFNDKFGHRAGDAILRQVAQTLKKAVRTSDLVARYGGEEMVIILYNANFENARMVGNKLVNIISDMVFITDNTTHKELTISVGVANFPIHASEPQQLIEIADKGLYKAKKAGRNQCCFLEPQSLQDASETPQLNETENTNSGQI
jgi:diguanylate cyclase (GGDEF)-like protein